MPADISDDLFNALLRVYHGAEQQDHVSAIMLADLTPNLARLRAAFAAAVEAGVESVPMQYGVQSHPNVPAYAPRGLDRDVAVKSAASIGHIAVERRASAWQPINTTGTEVPDDAR